MSHRRLILCLATVLVSTACATPRALAPARDGGKLSFDLESRLEPAAPVPAEALQVLSAHEDVREWLANNPPEKDAVLVLQAFEAAAVDLNGDGRADLVVRNRKLDGANIGPFWILARTESGYSVAFFTRSLGLDILRTATHGWHDLRTASATVDTLSETVYRFDGRSYEPSECYKTDLESEKTARVPCGPG
jgi:hypothetical protein